MTDDKRRLQIGRISKAHGLKGEVVVRLTTNRTERLDKGALPLNESRSAIRPRGARSDNAHQRAPRRLGRRQLIRDWSPSTVSQRQGEDEVGLGLCLRELGRRRLEEAVQADEEGHVDGAFAHQLDPPTRQRQWLSGREEAGQLAQQTWREQMECANDIHNLPAVPLPGCRT